MQWGRFFRDRFNLLYITLLFLLLLYLWVFKAADIRDFVVASFGALLTVLQSSLKTGATIPPLIQADNIEHASTEKGDIIGQPSAD